MSKIWLVAMICLLVLFYVSCGSKEGEPMQNVPFDSSSTEAGDIKAVEGGMKEYDLSQLKTFFCGRNFNENIAFDYSPPTLSYADVNQQYPVEITRPEGYSIYKIRQGGYFYVFWTTSFTSEINQLDNEAYVYFTAYLPSEKSVNDFDSLTPGKSTAVDVKKIDPDFELSFWLSHGVFSYSYINETTIMKIEYSHQGKIEGYADLTVKDVSVVSRDSVPSKYSAIILDDLP